MATPAAQLDQLIATTFQKVKPVLADQVTKETALLAALGSKSRITVDGGIDIRRPVMFDLNDTTGSYDGYDTIDVTPQDGFGYAVYSWKQYAGSVTISGKEERINSGAPAFIKLLSAKFDQLRLSFEKDMNTMLWGDGTGNASKDFLGLQAIVGNTGTLGGIDSATETWWKSYVDATAVSLATVAGVSYLNTALNTLRINKSRPDFEFTTQANFESYEDLAVPNIRFQDLKMADLGFEAVAHKTAEVIYEPDVPANRWYFVNSKHLEYVQHADAWMKMLDFVRPANQDAKTALVISQGNLITDVRRAHGVLTNVT